MPTDTVFRALGTSADGLTNEQARGCLARLGANRLQSKVRATGVTLLLRQFASPIILILIGAALLSTFLQDVTDAAIILSIVIVSGLLGFWQERGAASAVAKLCAVVETKVRVVRAGAELLVPLEQIVPGDLVLLSAGAVIPADCRLLEARDLFVNEAALTGETYPSEKIPAALPAKTFLAAMRRAPWERLMLIIAGRSCGVKPTALHGGDLPGYPASHGCIRLPREFAKRLYSITTRGTTAIVVDKKAPTPALAAQPGMILWPKEAGDLRPIEGAFEWKPEQSPEGPITILASTADNAVYVYRNGEPIGRAVLQIDDPKLPLGSHVFTMLEGLSETPSAFVRGRPAHRWMAVRTEGDATLRDLSRRVHVPPEFAEKIYDIISPGTTIVVTNASALPSASPEHEVPLMEDERK